MSYFSYALPQQTAKAHLLVNKFDFFLHFVQCGNKAPQLGFSHFQLDLFDFISFVIFQEQLKDSDILFEVIIVAAADEVLNIDIEVYKIFLL